MRITLSIPGNDSLKGKRRVVRRIADRVRNKFNVAVSEVAEQDTHRRAVLGFAVVSNSGSHANSMLDQIAAFVGPLTEAVIVDRGMELVHLGEDGLAGGNGPGGDDWWNA